MNKLVKLFITSISAITLALVSFTSSFAKVEGDYIVSVSYTHLRAHETN